MNSKLEEKDLEAERSVILREQEEVEANMMEFLLDHLHSIAFQRSPLCQTILGPKENIKKINRQQILDYINQNYKADKMVFTAVGGNVNHNMITDLVNKKFSALKPSDPGNYITLFFIMTCQ